MIISPSLLSCDFGNIQRDVTMLNASAAPWIHLDIMDGVFVPNISFGFPIVQAVRQYTSKSLDVHLMIHNPDVYLEEFKRAGADGLTVHFEGTIHLHRTVQRIKDLGLRAGVALNPHTPVSSITHLVKELDLVLIMSVNPGFGGQQFISESIRKVEEMKTLADESNPNLIIQVDGGVNLSNALLLSYAGANSLVAGSFIFNAENPMQTIEDLCTIP
ncbi:MAG: ribulose-phosphate 3-epimerase [Flavobacteriia bacterium]|nr:ribulose-phosphate 3-epimerase [Flavobacteriia bacterium]